MSSISINLDISDLVKDIQALGTRVQLLNLSPKDHTDLSNLINRVLMLLNTPPTINPPTVQKAEDGVANPIRTNLDYGERKQANIRGCTNACPFGLAIPRACKLVGKAIHQMEPVEGKSDKYASANKVIFAHCKEGVKCPYADKILDDRFGKVDCDYGDTGQGQASANYQGSPLYVQTFNGIGLNGLYGKPLGWYGDNSAARNLFFGLFSYLGREEYQEFVKLAQDTGLVMKYLANEIHKINSGG